MSRSAYSPLQRQVTRVRRRLGLQRLVEALVLCWLAGLGLGVLMPAFAGSVLLVVDVTLGRVAGLTAGGATLVGCLLLWGLLPKLVGRAVRGNPTSTAPRPGGTVPAPQGRDSVRAPADRLP